MESARRATVGINSAAPAAAAPELAWSGVTSSLEKVILLQDVEITEICISKASIATEKVSLRLWLTTQAVKANVYLNSDLQESDLTHKFIARSNTYHQDQKTFTTCLLSQQENWRLSRKEVSYPATMQSFLKGTDIHLATIPKSEQQKKTFLH